MHSQDPFPQPPKWIIRFLRWFCDARFHEEMEGDLYELFAELAEDHPLRKARRIFFFSSFSYLRPYFFSKKEGRFNLYPYLAMFSTTLKIALRILRRKPVYSFINISGLAMGIAAALLIFYYINDELKYDQFHEKGDRTYLIGTDNFMPNSEMPPSARSSRMIAPKLEENFPEVEETVRMYNRWTPQLKHNNQRFQDEIYFTESSFFHVFSHKLIEGDPETVLDEPYSIILTQKMANKYFGNEPVIGKTLTFDDSLIFKVTGLAADPPRHSHFTFDMLLSYSTWDNMRPAQAYEWANYWLYTYVTLKPGISKEEFEPKMTGLVEDNFGEKMKTFGLEVKLYLEPLPEIYLYSQRAGLHYTGDIKYIYIFAFIAVFLILIACVNFINLSTARSLDRAREVGIKKVVGSLRSNLIGQFLVESSLIAFFSLLLALLLTYAATPLFESISGKELIFSSLLSPRILLSLIGLTFLIGLLAGAYPAWVLSSFKPVEVLKGQFSHSNKGNFLRKGLIIFQFAISITLIAATLVVYGQLSYMQNKNLGFDKEQVLVLDARNPASEGLAGNYQNIKNELLKHSAVQQVSSSGRIPGFGSGGGVMFPEGLPEGESRDMSYFGVDHDYVKTMGLKVIAGRDFDKSIEMDNRESIIINQAVVENVGWGSPEEATGKVIKAGWNGQPLKVIGVIENYHHLSPRDQIVPEVIFIQPNWFQFFSAKVKAENVKEIVEYAEATWQTWFPEYPFSYFFLDEYYNRQYEAEERLTQIFGFFTFLAILIACFGLFGLAIFTVQQRTREIGIRKVLGASAGNIVSLLSKEFLVLVFVSFVIATPIAFWAMDKWLEEFAYKMALSLDIFLVAGAIAAILAMLAIGYQALRAAIQNPIESLRNE